MRKQITAMILIFSPLLLFAQFADVNNDQPVDVSAGRVTDKWEIERTILENTNGIVPLIIQGDSQLQANTIIYDSKGEIGYAFGNVIFDNKKDNTTLRAGEGTYNTKKKEIIAKQRPVLYLRKDNTTAKSDIMKIYPNRDYINMIGDVWITNKKFLMEGDQANLFNKTGKFIINGHAKASQEGSVIHSDKLDIDSKNGQLESYTADGNVKVIDKKEGYTIESGRLDYYKDLGYSKITKHPVLTFTNKNVKAYSITMEKYDKEDKANLLGNVIIVQGNKKAYAKWGEYFTKDKKMILTGSPYLVQEKSKFSANKIVVDIDSETMSMIGRGSGIFEYKNR
jgi:lipopolysaccharide export system protein LptA